MIISKTLIPNKEWILKNEGEKIGTIAKIKKGYNFLKKGNQLQYKSIDEIRENFGIEITLPTNQQKLSSNGAPYHIYNFPCSSPPFDDVYNVKKKLPLFAKSLKSKSRYCAGYYIIKFRKGWVKSFCPKLITLERYKFVGPFKTEQEMKTMLNMVNKNETT
jgi:hypothetical protein